MAFAYEHRKRKKRDFRRLWIARINAAARINGMSYNRFMYGLKLADVNINRKIMADMAINDPVSFTVLVDLARSKVDTAQAVPTNA